MPAHRLATLSLAALLTFASAARAAPAGVDLAGMDPKVPPDQDFFLYTNGTWYKKTEIPADRSSTGVGREVQERTDKRVRDLIEQAAKKKLAPGSDAQRVGDAFASYMDEATLEKKGASPLTAGLSRIAALADRRQLAEYLGASLRADVDIFNSTDVYTPHVLGIWIAADPDEPTRYVPFLVQGGLTMPDREYYTDESAPMAETRAKYREHVVNAFGLAGFDNAGARAARVEALEMKIAKAHASREDTNDIEKGNNHWRAADFAKKAPGLDWTTFLGAAHLGTQDNFVIWQPSAVVGLSKLVAEEPLETWKDYLAFHWIDEGSPYLSKVFLEEYFAFHNRALEGTPQLSERWKRGVSYAGDVAGQAVGRLYVKRWFPEASKRRVTAMVRELIAAFGTRIDALAWMAPETKAKAKAKLAVLKIGVGYPDKWTDDRSWVMARDDLYGNTERAAAAHLAGELKKLGTPVDRDEWFMDPQLVNAVNLPVLNAMNFPAAILQPPYFDPARPDSMNYGAIGAIIGHEISHSFDNQGALFDDAGRLSNWWTKEDFAHFSKAGEALAAQYDAYEALPGLHIKGGQVLAENIADLAGLALAYDAWTASLKGKPAAKVQRLTGPQQFFIAYGQSWRTKMREPALRQRILTDGHSPAMFRVQTVRNLDVFYDNFPTDPSHALYLAPKDRIRVW